MVTEEVITSIPPEFLQELYTLSFFIQAIGGILLFYVIFNIINMILARKKNLQIKKINENLEEIKDLLKNKK